MMTPVVELRNVYVICFTCVTPLAPIDDTPPRVFPAPAASVATCVPVLFNIHVNDINKPNGDPELSTRAV